MIPQAIMEAVMNSEATIADVTTSNPNVLYELGLRHAVNPDTTVVTHCDKLPDDLMPIFTVSYAVAGEEPTLAEAGLFRENLTTALSLGNNGQKDDKYRSPLHRLFPELHVYRPREPCVFIGHGRNKLWERVQRYLEDDLHLKTITYESEGRAGLSIVPILEQMLRVATFAVLILTGEDETAGGSLRARQNVVHEAGLFQGYLGFRRAVILLQNGLEEFSNIAGLQCIPFGTESIEATFRDLGSALMREGLIKSLIP